MARRAMMFPGFQHTTSHEFGFLRALNGHRLRRVLATLGCSLWLTVGCGDKPAEPKVAERAGPSETSKNRASPGSPAKSEAQQGKGGPAKPAKAEPGEGLPTPDALFQGHLKAAGGKAAVSAIRSLHVVSKLEIAGQNLRGDAEFWWQAPGKFYTEDRIPGMGVTRAGSDGSLYWADDPVSQLRELTGVEAEQYQWISSVFLPLEWQRFFKSAKTVTKREFEGRRYYDVELVTKQGQAVGISFDADSQLMASQRFRQLAPTGAVPMEVELSDYREIAGYKMPHRLETRISIATAVQTYVKVEANVKVDETRFNMPSTTDAVHLDPAKQPAAKVGKAGRRLRRGH